MTGRDCRASLAMTFQHPSSLAVGRVCSDAVRRYLVCLYERPSVRYAPSAGSEPALSNSRTGQVPTGTLQTGYARRFPSSGLLVRSDAVRRYLVCLYGRASVRYALTSTLPTGYERRFPSSGLPSSGLPPLASGPGVSPRRGPGGAWLWCRCVRRS